jgi:gliding-associated putative ABC transporter substrate-binding component GldG
LLSKKTGTPRLVSLNEIGNVDQNSFHEGNQILGVLLSGNFKSAYKDRVQPFDTPERKDSCKNEMIVISDGDIASNMIYKNRPTDLSGNFLTGEQFGNKAFLLNAVNYLMQDTSLIKLRSKTIQLRFLDKQKAVAQAGYWQLVNILVPLLILLLFGFGFRFYRKLKFGRN